MSESAPKSDTHVETHDTAADNSCEADVKTMAHELSRDAKQAENDDPAEKTGLGSVSLRSISLHVEGMACSSCADSVKAALSGLEHATHIIVDVESGVATLRLAGDADEAVQALRSQGMGATVLV
ncbi:hypothetical protein BWQ96_07603 [Gracilariopsis chorda]|uniref:HMA domain-containing protein n=1 Tax=Gracilariopsis chorda TaxID=448386 RepID=A0A2V3INF9_9FLOR|nr:hypothetical protein BWQ96_07603 [Gracilariopsis chorda]|eukprot:PXF42660.1 hypothetical protein BWQ96_07603 [Gracilariopsis chorda]